MVREIYEEALDVKYNGVKTVKDFNIVFNSLIQFEKDVLDSIERHPNPSDDEDKQIIASSNIDDQFEE